MDGIISLQISNYVTQENFSPSSRQFRLSNFLWASGDMSSCGCMLHQIMQITP